MARTTPLLKNRSTRLERGSACDSGIRDGHSRFGTSVFGPILNRHCHLFPLPCWSPDRPHLSGCRRKRPELASALGLRWGHFYLAMSALKPILRAQRPVEAMSHLLLARSPAQKGLGGKRLTRRKVAQHQKFFALPLKLFLGFQIFLSPHTRPGRLRGPEI